MDGIRTKAARALRRPIGKLGWTVLLGIVLTGPAWLFFAPADPITREPLHSYRLHRDDFEYLARSRTLRRTAADLFTPHNVHVVPAWRLATSGLVVCAGRISRFPAVLAIASYGMLIAAMLLTARLTARETNRPALGLAAAIATGTTSTMLSAASWYSAGQTLWAGVGVLLTLCWLQDWRRRGGAAPLLLAGGAAMVAGWLWTVGHVAGLVGAAYLAADRRPASRRAALVPLLASAAAVLVTAVLAWGRVAIPLGGPGRAPGASSLSLGVGVVHTLQAIPEFLVLGNLGLTAETTPTQGAILTAALVALWGWTRLRPRTSPEGSGSVAAPLAGRLVPNPLEAAGGVMILSAYLLEWTFRSGLPFSSLRWEVPWYDTIPHLGAVLFGAGWFGALLESPPAPSSRPAAAVAPSSVRPKIRRGQAVALALLVVGLVIANRPRVDAKWHYLAPEMYPSERDQFLDGLWVQRDNYLLQEQAERQHRHLQKLERAEAVAKAQGIGLEELHTAFGRLGAPLLPEVYDAAGLLDLPERGKPISPAIRMRLIPLLTVEPEPRPTWLQPDDPWPRPARSDRDRTVEPRRP